MKNFKINLKVRFALALSLLFIISAFIGACGKDDVSGIKVIDMAPHDMAVVNIALGDSESAVVMTGKGTALIDAGDEEDARKILSFLSANGIKSLEYMILTNFEEEHIGGAAQIIDTLDIRRVLIPVITADDMDEEEYLKLTAAMKNKNITPYTVAENLGFSLADANFTVYSGTNGAYSDDRDENMSLVVSAQHGLNTFLFASDIQRERMAEIMDKERDFGHTYMKVPDHGEFEKNSADFFNFVNPSFAVITNDSASGAKKARSALEKIGTAVYVADKKNVYAVSNLEEINFYQE